MDLVLNNETPVRLEDNFNRTTRKTEKLQRGIEKTAVKLQNEKPKTSEKKSVFTESD